VGVAAALVLLVGGSIAFASQTLNHGSDPGQAAVGAPPPPPLTVLPPASSTTRASTIDLTALASADLRRDQHYVVRVFVNDTQTSRTDLPDSGQIALTNVPLDEGQNSIRVSLVGAGGESALSSPITIIRDDVAPEIKIVQPTDKVYTESETLVGTTEPGADMQITDGAGQTIESSIGPDGRFSASLDLHVGNNTLMLRSTDPAGNHASISYTVVRASSAATIDLSVTPTDVYMADLPATVELSATLRDELGRPVADGTQVIFGVSPPDRETTTYTATTTNGRARFTGLSMEPGDATGAWLVTALATLPSGIELRADASFSLNAGAPKSAAPH
jgi:hypothetical protein